MPRMSEWLVANWGNVASVAGLLLTIGTLILAQQAKAAADAARAAVERRSLAQDLRDMVEAIGSVLLFADGARFDLAAHACYGVITDLNFFTSRWVAHLDARSSEQLTSVVSQLEIVSVQLRKFRQASPRPKEFELLSESIFKVNNMLAAEVGKYEARQ